MSDAKYRNAECIAISECLNTFEPMTTMPTKIIKELASSLERGILNAAIDKAKEKGIPTYWSNEDFLAQYDSISFNMKINMDVNSSINKDRPDHIKYHTIRKIFNYVKLRYFKYALVEAGFLPAGTVSALMSNLIGVVDYFDPRNMGCLNSYELNPNINMPYIEEIRIREQQETKIKHSTMYLCVCGERKTISYELQTRSLDEGGTQFIKCIACGKVWTSRN
jgi:DNA-directed RNA polymerase subunit M/transcription elongation factor TFIIS